MKTTERIFGVAEIQNEYGYAESTVRNAISSGELVSFKDDDGRRRVKESDLLAWRERAAQRMPNYLLEALRKKSERKKTEHPIVGAIKILDLFCPGLEGKQDMGEGILFLSRHPELREFVSHLLKAAIHDIREFQRSLKTPEDHSIFEELLKRAKASQYTRAVINIAEQRELEVLAEQKEKK